MTEQAAARRLVERDAAEVAAPDSGYAVVAGEPLVDERVVGREQVEDAPVLAQHAVEEQLRLAAERLAEPFAEVGENVLVRLHGGGVPQRQPLAGEVAREGVRARIGEHPRHLRVECRLLAQLSPLGEVEKLVVRDTAPEEERQARRQLEVADAVVGVRRRARRVPLDAEEELRADQQPADRHLDAGVEAAAVAAALVEVDQTVHVLTVDRPAERAPREGREDVPRARGLFIDRRAGGGPARQDPLPARRLVDRARAAGFVRSGDRHALHVGLIARIPAGSLAGERPEVELADPFRLGRRLAKERDPHFVRSRRDRDANLQRFDLRHVEAARIVLVGRLADGQQLDPFTVDRDFEVVRLDAQRPVRQHLDDVLGIFREVVLDHHAAPRTEREAFHPDVLPEVGRDAEGLGGRRRHGRRHREAAHLARRREVPIHERRRDAEHAGDVVEAVARVVRRQQVVDVHVEGQQVADGVAVLGAAEPMERLGPPRIGTGGGRGVEFAFQPGAKRVVGGVVRTRPGTGRHGAGPQFPDHLFPLRGMRRDVRRVDRLKREAAGLQPVVVTGDAVTVEQRLLIEFDRGARRTRGLGRRRGRRSRRQDDGDTACNRRECKSRASRHLRPPDAARTAARKPRPRRKITPF